MPRNRKEPRTEEDRRHDHEKNDVARLEVVGAQPAHFPFARAGLRNPTATEMSPAGVFCSLVGNSTIALEGRPVSRRCRPREGTNHCRIAGQRS